MPRSKPTKKQPAQQTTNRGKLNKIGALWLGKGQNGTYMSGRIELAENEELRVLVFKNGYKTESRHPDYVIYEPTAEDSENVSPTVTDDDIPF